jgi:hypothetical protein
MANSPEAVTHIRVNYDGKEAERGLRNLKSAITTAFSVVAVKQIYDFTAALAKAGAEGIRTEKTFSNFVPNVAEATAKLEKASLGMIENTVLQRNAIQALISGIKFDDYLVALEYAAKFAINTGKNTEDVLSQITSSFLTGRTMGLKQAGIVVNTGKNMVRDSIDQMKSKMGELGASIDDPIVKMNQLTAGIENQKERIGRDLIPVINVWNAGLIDLAKGAADAAGKLAGFLKYLAMLRVAGGDRELVSLRMRIESAKGLEDKQAAINVLEGIKNELTKQSIPLQKRINEISSSGYTARIDNQKESVKKTEELNKLLQVQQEIEGALFIVRNKKDIKKGGYKPPPLGLSDEEREKQNKKEIERLDKEIEQIDKTEKYIKDKKEERLKWEYEYQDRLAAQQKTAQDMLIQIEHENLSESVDGKLKILEEEYVRRQLIVGQNL